MAHAERRLGEGAFRHKVIACDRGGTFKYFFMRDDVKRVWQLLVQTYGPLRQNDALKTMEVEGSKLLFRATHLGNPITVVRKARCAPEDVASFHELVGFDEERP